VAAAARCEASDTSIAGLARAVATAGADIGLPLVAACADISSARPIVSEGLPIGALFDFTEAAGDYWLQGDLALRNAIVAIVRWMVEPFYYDQGVLGSWRPMNVSGELLRAASDVDFSVRSSIVAPVHLPGSVIGAVVWATDSRDCDVRELFERHAARLHVLALRFISACDALAHGPPSICAYRLTRREIQCLKLAAAGKTDGEIATILALAVPTVRFHLKKAWVKLGENGRLRIVQHATALGFVSVRP